MGCASTIGIEGRCRDSDARGQGAAMRAIHRFRPLRRPQVDFPTDSRSYVEGGGLMSYAPISRAYRQAASTPAVCSRARNRADLPVLQPTVDNELEFRIAYHDLAFCPALK